MGDPRTEQGKDSPFLAKIRTRAEQASPKVQKRVLEVRLPFLRIVASRAPYELEMVRNDYYHLVKDLKNPAGGGQYDDWTPDEIREIYFVLFGENMDE